MALVADYDSQVWSGQSVTMTAYDGNDSGAAFSWRQIAGPKVELENADSATASFKAPEVSRVSELLAFKLTLTNALGASEVTKVNYTVLPASNVIVQALTKSKTMLAGTTVHLHAAGTGATRPSFRWTQLSPSSPVIQLTDDTTDSPSFVAPDTDGVSYTFQVAYTDTATGRSASDKVRVLVYKVPSLTTLAPLTLVGTTSIAGLQGLQLIAPPDASVVGGGSIKLAFAVSGGNQPYNWSWSQVNGTNATLTSTNQAVLSIAVPALSRAETLSFRANVTDASGKTVSGVARVQVLPQPSLTASPPIPPQVVPQQLVSLPQLVSVPGTPVTYTTLLANPVIAQTGGSVAALTASTAANGATLISITPPSIVTSTEHIQITITGQDSAGRTVRQVLPVVVMRSPNLAPPVVAPPVVQSQVPQIVPGQVTLAPRVDVKPGATTAFTTTLANPTVAQTGGTSATISASTNSMGVTTISVTAPAIAGSAEQLQITVSGIGANGQTVQQVVPVLIINTPNQAPPAIVPPLIQTPVPQIVTVQPAVPGQATSTPPPQIVYPYVPPSLALKVDNCSPTRVNEGQSGVVLCVQASGGTGTYTYQWRYRPTLTIPSLAIRDADTSHPSIDIPLIEGRNAMVFDVRVSDGSQSVTKALGFSITDLSPPASLVTMPELTVPSGARASLTLPQPRWGAPPYRFSISQRLGPSVGAVDAGNPVFTAPTLAAGASDLQLAFDITVTDSTGSTGKAFQNVYVKAPAPPLAVVLSGPSSGAQGASISLNTNVTGGKAPYTYRYVVSGGSVSIPSSGNPGLTLPTLAAGAADQNLSITLTVTDSSTPTQSVSSAPLAIIVAAPPAPVVTGGGTQVASQAVVDAKSTAAVQAADGAISAALAAGDAAAVQAQIDALRNSLTDADYAALPDSRAASVPKDAAAQQFAATCEAQGSPLDFSGPCENGFEASRFSPSGACVASFAGMFGECYVAAMCMKAAGLCQGVTPAMKLLLDQSAQRLQQLILSKP